MIKPIPGEQLSALNEHDAHLLFQYGVKINELVQAVNKLANPTPPDTSFDAWLDGVLDAIEKGAAVVGDDVIVPRAEAKAAITAKWQEREAAIDTAARVDELKHLDSLTYSFMSLGNDFDYSYRQSAVDDRIATLTNNKEPQE